MTTKRRLTFVALLVALLVGGAATLVVLPQGDDDDAARTIDEAPETADRRRVSPALVASAPETGPLPTVEAEPEPRSAQRTLVLHGIVLGDDGRPVPSGVAIELRERASHDLIDRTATTDGGWWELETKIDADHHELEVRAREVATGQHSSANWVDVWSAPMQEFVLLRLRDIVTVTGRVVDGMSEPVVGAPVTVHGMSLVGEARPAARLIDVMGEHVGAVSGAGGRFSANVRSPGGRVRAWSVSGRGVFGPVVSHDVRERGVVDLGDVPLPGDAVAIWEIEVRDTEGRPCANAILRFVGREHMYAETLPDFDAERSGVVIGDDGVARIELACQPDPVVLAIGGGWSVPQQFAIDRSTAGEQRARVVLQPRAVAIVRFVGLPAAAREIDDLFATVRTGESNRRRSTQTLDIRSGAVSTATQGPYMAPIRMMHGGANPARSWISDDELEVLTDQPALVEVRLQIERVGLCSGAVTTGRPPQRSEFTIATGRIVELDLRALRAWARAHEDEGWPSRYCAWPHRDDVAVSGDGSLAGSPDVTGLIALRSEEAMRSERAMLALPPGVDRVAVGLARRERMGKRTAQTLETVLDVPAGPRPIVVVPPPQKSSARLATIRARVRYEGKILRRAGIPLQISGRRGAAYASESTAMTDADGVATFRVLPGTYAAAAHRSIATRDRDIATWPTVEARAPGAEIDVVVDLVWLQW